jgi:hypothetical protein
MMARLGGLVVALIGLALALAGGGLGLALLGEPVPDLPGLRELSPYLAQIAQGAALPAGSGWADLTGSTPGMIALAGLGAGLMIVLAGLAQLVTGERTGLGLVLLVAAIGGFAVAVAVA